MNIVKRLNPFSKKTNKEETLPQSKNTVVRSLDPLPVPARRVQKDMNEKMWDNIDQYKAAKEPTVFPNIRLDEIPGYRDWLNSTAQDYVIRLLGNVGMDGTLYTFPCGISYLYPTGRYFFPTALFTNKLDFIDPTVPGFILDVSDCRDLSSVRVRIHDYVVLRTTGEQVWIPNESDDEKRIQNPLNM